MSDHGRLYGEIPLGYYLVRRLIERIDGFPPELEQAVLHIILSHHGSLEHGSPVVPCTREATLVHMIDNLGGRLGSFDRLERGLPQASSGRRTTRRSVAGRTSPIGASRSARRRRRRAEGGAVARGGGAGRGLAIVRAGLVDSEPRALRARAVAGGRSVRALREGQGRPWSRFAGRDDAQRANTGAGGEPGRAEHTPRAQHATPRDSRRYWRTVHHRHSVARSAHGR